MPGPNISKSGNAQIKKVGHTIGTKHGTAPMKQMRGEAKEPTPIDYKG